MINVLAIQPCMSGQHRIVSTMQVFFGSPCLALGFSMSVFFPEEATADMEVLVFSSIS